MKTEPPPGPGPAGAALETPVAVPDGRQGQEHVFLLFIAGYSGKSAKAVVNIKRLCEKHLSGNYELDVIDIFQDPEAAVASRVLVLPTLIRTLPLPVRRFIGDLYDSERVVVGLRLSPDGDRIRGDDDRAN